MSPAPSTPRAASSSSSAIAWRSWGCAPSPSISRTSGKPSPADGRPARGGAPPSQGRARRLHRRSRRGGGGDGRGLRALHRARAATSAASSRPAAPAARRSPPPAMRRLPIGVPKVMVSTVASGDVKALRRPVRHLHDVLGHRRRRASTASPSGARQRRARAGRHDRPCPPERLGRDQAGDRPHHVRRHHPVRAGGRPGARGRATTASSSTPPAPAGSRWRSWSIPACSPGVDRRHHHRDRDLIVGGVLPRRARTASTRSSARALPYVGSCGALDMVNFGRMRHGAGALPRPQSLPPQSAGHPDAHHGGGERAHRALGSASKLNRMEGPVRFLIPEGGVSLLDAAGRAVLGSRGRSRRCSRRSQATVPRRRHAGRLDPPALQHQRSGLRRGAGRRLPRDRRSDAQRPRAEHADASHRTQADSRNSAP